MDKSVILLYVAALAASFRLVSSSALCPHESDFFRYSLQSQCPISISPHPPLKVDGNYLDRALASQQRTDYTAVFFYASWCPLSRTMYPTFEKLSFMFPQVEHLAIEQSSALPSVFSRYGIHSFPSILLVNQTSMVRYHGPKTLSSLAQFYQKTTGLEPVQYIDGDHTVSLNIREKSIIRSMSNMSLREISRREPFLAFATVFLCLRVLLYIFPKVLTRLQAFWVLYVPHFNLGIFGETSQIMGRILHMVDVRRIWTKLRLCKTRNFHEGAKNARVWASSLTSVSLGKSSSARSSTN
ncbi:5'-adenylylsulfate reductase-like 5 [Pyrus x bretschneideri]|uniref:5'-adenylylsulfate reductase-like 5 n=1 Tax=Pyrus x bretschneideri TaxID=225117 RepID=UPI0005110727|nr:5'-adenylylsulfate reductase-like 5 [Pyrus x bretschneideri]